MDARARLVAAVIHGSAVKEGTAPIAAGRSAAQATGSEVQWLGNTDEEKARINSWMEADLSNDKLIIADLEKVLETSSFVALPARETAADLVVYSALNSKVTGGEAFQKSNPNVSRWMNHMQGLIAKLTGNPELVKFKVSGLRAVVQAETPAVAAPTKAPEQSEKKEKKADKKEAKKESGEVAKDSVAAVPAAGDAAGASAKKEVKEKAKEAKPKEEKPAKGEEEEPKKKKAAPAAAASAEGGEFLPLQLDVRVGKILSAKQLTEKLYIEEIDVGEEQPRTICSGLVQFYASADMISGKDVLVVCNLKPRKMADSESNGMVLAASNADKTAVKLVEAPAGSKPGDRISYTNAPPTPSEFLEPNKVNKKKVLESVMPGWGTDAEGKVTWTDKEKNTVHTMLVNGQPCLAGDIKNGTVG